MSNAINAVNIPQDKDNLWGTQIENPNSVMIGQYEDMCKQLANAKERIAALATENEEIRAFAQDKIREVQQDYEEKMKAWGITCALQTFGLCKEWKIAPSFDEVAELASRYEQYAMKKETVQ